MMNATTVKAVRQMNMKAVAPLVPSSSHHQCCHSAIPPKIPMMMKTAAIMIRYLSEHALISALIQTDCAPGQMWEAIAGGAARTQSGPLSRRSCSGSTEPGCQ